MKKSILVVSVLFILAGIVLTLENFRIVHGVSVHWPALVCMLGAGFVFLFFQEKKGDAALLWLGTFISSLGIFFYYLNFAGWSSMAYLWPLFLLIAGLGFLVITILTRMRLFFYLTLLFLALFGSMFLIFSVSIKLWPVSMIVFGLSLMWINVSFKKLENQ